MNSSVLEGQWRQIRGKIKEEWGDLTDDARAGMVFRHALVIGDQRFVSMKERGLGF